MVKQRTPYKTAVGSAQYPYIQHKDTKYGDEYKTKLVMVGEEAKCLTDKIREEFIKAHSEKDLAQAKMPFKATEDGATEFTFKSKMKPKVFDSQNNPITQDIRIGNGSKIQVAGVMEAWASNIGKGVKCYLNSVKVVDLKEFTGGSPFEKTEGGYTIPANENNVDDGDF